MEVRNRFKGLDLIDRVSEELCTGGSDQDHCQEKCKKAKWLSEEALQVAEKRREVKVKGEKERDTGLNAEFQRIAKRDKKAFLINHCKEIDKINKMGKTSNLFKKLEIQRENFMQR